MGHPSIKEVETCPRCGKNYPLFNDEGKHNFCPTVGPNGQPKNVCIDCKMKDIVRKWES